MFTHLIGLTGGIGSGKSAIAEGLRALGYPTYDSDRAAQSLINKNLAVRSQIELLFGSDIYVNGEYDRQRVSRLVFADPQLLSRLNAIVHPAVMSDLKQWAKSQTARFSFIESAILFESGLDKLCRATVCITAPEELRIHRTIRRDNATEAQVLARIHNQMAEEERQKRASWVIHNDRDADISELCLQIQKFCSTFVD